MIKDLVTLDNDITGILRKKLDTVPLEEIPNLQQEIKDMIDTMYASGGLGLAANQIGLDKQIFVLRSPANEPLVAINPEILSRSSKKIKSYGEGCLSCPEAGRRDIRRSRDVKLAALDKDGQLFTMKFSNKLVNIAIQHEMDHLNGVLIIDK